MSDLLLGYPNTPSNLALGKEKYVQDWRGDLQFDNRGRLMLVKDAEQLKQNIGKILLTNQGTNSIHSDYGSVLQTFVGTPLLESSVYSLIKQTILNALGFYVTEYADSTNIHEKVANVESLSVMIDDKNASALNVMVRLTNEASEALGIQIVLE